MTTDPRHLSLEGRPRREGDGNSSTNADVGASTNLLAALLHYDDTDDDDDGEEEEEEEEEEHKQQGQCQGQGQVIRPPEGTQESAALVGSHGEVAKQSRQGWASSQCETGTNDHDVGEISRLKRVALEVKACAGDEASMPEHGSGKAKAPKDEKKEKRKKERSERSSGTWLPSITELIGGAGPLTVDKTVRPQHEDTHLGRKRTFEHVEGNFAVHVYIPLIPGGMVCHRPDTESGQAGTELKSFESQVTGYLQASMRALDAAASDVSSPLKDVKFVPEQDIRNLHLSLSRTWPLKKFELEGFFRLVVGELRSLIRKCPEILSSDSPRLGDIEFYRNDECTRLFATWSILDPVSASVTSASTNREEGEPACFHHIRALIRAIDRKYIVA